MVVPWLLERCDMDSVRRSEDIAKNLKLRLSLQLLSSLVLLLSLFVRMTQGLRMILFSSPFYTTESF